MQKDCVWYVLGLATFCFIAALFLAFTGHAGINQFTYAGSFLAFSSLGARTIGKSQIVTNMLQKLSQERH